VSIIWRDDDVLLKRHQLGLLLAADDIFQRAGRVHTIAVIASTLTCELAAVIRERRMSAQLHCWQHDDLSKPGADARLAQAVARIEDLVGVRPTVLYPPWNRTSVALEAAAAELGLTVSAVKVSLEQFIRCDGGVAEDVVNFHFWHDPDVRQLARALALEKRP
jgi:peptidoglycan/xylan/chitin deacetylase (PgdA/CDA1 family)